MPTDESYEGWAIVELFGHRVIPSYVKPVTMYGATFAKLDTRDTLEPPLVQFYGASAIYSIRPTTEEEVRKRNEPYVYRSALVAGDAEIVVDDDSWSPDDEDDLPSEHDSDAPRAG